MRSNRLKVVFVKGALPDRKLHSAGSLCYPKSANRRSRCTDRRSRFSTAVFLCCSPEGRIFDRSVCYQMCVAEPAEGCVCMKGGIAIDHRSRCLKRRLCCIRLVTSTADPVVLTTGYAAQNSPAKALRLRPPNCSRVISEHFSYHKVPIAVTSTSYP